MANVIDLPNTGKVADALLALIGLCDGLASSGETYGPLAQFFVLSDIQLSHTTKAGFCLWHNKVQFARQELASKGLVELPQKPNPTSSQKANKGVQGIWILTSDGKRAAERQLSSFGAAARNLLMELAAEIAKQRKHRSFLLEDF